MLGRVHEFMNIAMGVVEPTKLMNLLTDRHKKIMKLSPHLQIQFAVIFCPCCHTLSELTIPRLQTQPQMIPSCLLEKTTMYWYTSMT